MIKDWGTVRQRLGAESFKKLDQCFLCLGEVVSPVVCPKGHLFCAECIVRNFGEQREANRRLMARWQQQQDTGVAKGVEARETEQEKAESAFRVQHEHIPSSGEWDRFEDERRYGMMTEEEQLLARARDNLREKRTIGEEAMRKEEMIKKSFWVPEVAPTTEEAPIEKPDMHTVCPVPPKHHCKGKKLITVVMLTDAASHSPQCWVCLKVLTHHSAYVLRRCGHLLCTECAKSFCAGACSVCSVPCTATDFIPLVPKGTMFAAHNKVEAAIKNPVFIC